MARRGPEMTLHGPPRRRCYRLRQPEPFGPAGQSWQQVLLPPCVESGHVLDFTVNDAHDPAPALVPTKSRLGSGRHTSHAPARPFLVRGSAGATGRLGRRAWVG